MRLIKIGPSVCFVGLLLTSGAAAQINNKTVTPDMTDRQASALQERYRASDYDLGLDELTAGKFRQAAQHLQRAIKTAPTDATIMTVYGQALEGLKDWRGAEAAFAQALALNRDQLLARREHGVVLARLGQLDSARAELNVLKARADACADDCVGAVDVDHAVDIVRAAVAGASAARPTDGPVSQRGPGVNGIR